MKKSRPQAEVLTQGGRSPKTGGTEHRSTSSQGLKERLKEVRTSVENQSQSNHSILSGRFRVG